MQRWRPVALMIAWLALAAPAAAQSTGGKMAILIRNPDTSRGEPPYALADQYGRVQRLVESSPGDDLSRYIGQRVRIQHDTGRTLLASQLELPGLSGAAASGELRPVSPAQFVPPRRAAPIESRRRRFEVQTAQAEEPPGDALGTFADDPGAFDTLPGPGPAPTPADPTTPIDLDSLPEPGGRRESIEPIPAGDYDTSDYRGYEEVPLIEPSHRGHDPDCPHCNKNRVAPVRSAHADDCPQCRAQAAPAVDYCQTCGRTEGWCGPSCTPASKRGPYGRVEYLLWWFDGMTTPPLATTNDQGNAPVLGNAGTRVIYGGDELLDGARNGLRFTFGAWLDSQRDIALELDYLVFETKSDTFAINDPTGAGVLGRPFYNVAPVDQDTLAIGAPIEDAQIIALAGQAGGALTVYSRSEFESFGARVRTGVCCRDVGGGCNPCGCDSCRGSGLLRLRGSRPQAISRIDFFTGYRFATLEEALVFGENSTILSGPLTGGTVAVSESFSTDNDFHGVDLGFVYDWQSKRWGLELTSRIAIGATSQQVAIAGSNTVGTTGTAGVTTAGGLLAQTSNIGVYERDRFSVLPELSARLSYRITPRVSVSAAYSLLYWANVVRPGDQIDYSVDGRLASGALVTPDANSHPRFDWEETSLWAHGFNFGVDYQY